jgi:hypothetical protein
MYAIILAALLSADDKAGQPAAAGGRPGDLIDGTWTVLSVEKNGQPVPGAKNMTVHVKDNIVTFDSRGGEADKDNKGDNGNKGQMPGMRVSFGPNGTILVAEANGDGVIESPGARPPVGGRSHGSVKTGVYILSHDYMAICIHDVAPQPIQQAGAPLLTSGPTSQTRCTVFLKRANGEGHGKP